MLPLPAASSNEPTLDAPPPPVASPQETSAQLEKRVHQVAVQNPALLPVGDFGDVCREPQVNLMMQNIEKETGLPRSIVALAAAYEELPVAITKAQFDKCNQVIAGEFNRFLSSGQISTKQVIDNASHPEKET